MNRTMKKSIDNFIERFILIKTRMKWYHHIPFIGVLMYLEFFHDCFNSLKQQQIDEAIKNSYSRGVDTNPTDKKLVNFVRSLTFIEMLIRGGIVTIILIPFLIIPIVLLHLFFPFLIRIAIIKRWGFKASFRSI